MMKLALLGCERQQVRTLVQVKDAKAPLGGGHHGLQSARGQARGVEEQRVTHRR
jgi:hypothetical protein